MGIGGVSRDEKMEEVPIMPKVREKTSAEDGGNVEKAKENRGSASSAGRITVGASGIYRVVLVIHKTQTWRSRSVGHRTGRRRWHRSKEKGRRRVRRRRGWDESEVEDGNVKFSKSESPTFRFRPQNRLTLTNYCEP